jgi:hypothetical protein
MKLCGRVAVTVVSAVLVCMAATSANASVAIVVEHNWTIGNNYFSAFAYDPATDEFRTGGYGANFDIRWSHVLDDTVLPWGMEGGVILTADQQMVFARNGYPTNYASFQCWGMSFNPLDGKYFVTVIASQSTASGGTRFDTEPDLVQLDDRLPDSLTTAPTYASVSNIGGVYALTDTSLVGGQPRAAFVTRGVAVGTRLTLFAVDIYADCVPGTYTVTQVVSETELRLDRDPCGSPNEVVADVGYIMSLQAHVTLQKFRQVLPWFATKPTKGPKANYSGGVSLDGQTLYVGEQMTDNIIAVNTQAHDDFSVFVSQQTLVDYVHAEKLGGRLRSDLDPRIYGSSMGTGWTATGTGATVNINNTTPLIKYSGTKSIAVTFTSPTGLMNAATATALDPTQYDKIYFWMHGGPTGGHQMNLVAYNSSSVDGTPVALAPTVASQWTRYDVPFSAFGTMTDVKGFKWVNSAGAAQPVFYIDEIRLKYSVRPTGWGDYDDMVSTSGSFVPAVQVAVDSGGRIWFSNGETDDIMWTTDGTTLHPFLRSNQIFEAVSKYPGNLGMFSTTPPGNGVQLIGLTVDKMGTVYWSDNATREIWKCPATGNPAHIRRIATQEEIMTALGLGSTLPRGLGCFTIRGTELLTYNFVDSNTIYKADINTPDYGDYDGDIDVDADDFGMFFADCLAGPGVLTPSGGCTAEQFALSDLDKDGDVDLGDYGIFQEFSTGPLP